jgi:pyrimidine-nucleoside phosphorylase
MSFALDVILAKRSGAAHDRATLQRFVQGVSDGSIPDHQIAAWLMAVVWRGMSERETADLTEAMARSGEMLDLRAFPHAVDKHSTGGVGDKTTLVLAPLFALFGAQVAKMSGRGLGHTGGTIDKLESIPGFSADLDPARFFALVERVGVALSAQTTTLAPADGRLYALRDVTGTIDSLPLIASSIMSKKLAGGAGALVLDVKVGRGAFLPDVAQARALARAMIDVGTRAGRRVSALLTAMDEPLGAAVGNALEVVEAIRVLQGGGPADVREVVVALAVEGLALAGVPRSTSEVERALDDGRAYERFVAWVEAQGGDPRSLSALPIAPDVTLWRAPRAGVIVGLDPLAIGRAVVRLGGGREAKGDAIDPGVGVVLHADVGDAVGEGEALASVHHRGGRGLEAAMRLLAGAVEIGEHAERAPVIRERWVGA